MERERYCVIVPAHNEGSRLRDVLSKIEKYTKNIIVVDDGSSDNTSEVAKQQDVIVLRHIINLGKGAALKTGCDYALDHNFDIIIAMDADGQHDPDEIPNFLEALKDKDIVFGVRSFDKNMPLISRFGNWFISTVTKIAYGIKIQDTQCGFRAFTRETYKKIRWSSLDYSVESEMIANSGSSKLRYTTIPIKTIYLDKYKGTTFLTGLRIVMNLILWKLRKK